MDEKLIEALVNSQKMTAEVLKELTGKLEKHDAAGTTQTANPLHGFNGLFSTPGIDREVITAHVRPSGIASVLPVIPSVDENPIFASVTGFTKSAGAQPNSVCEVAPKAHIKGCNLTARFGQLRFDTNTIDFDKVMLRVNRGDMTDLVLRGRLLGMDGGSLAPSKLSEDAVLNILTMSEMVTVGVQFERELTRQIWQGTYGVGDRKSVV